MAENNLPFEFDENKSYTIKLPIPRDYNLSLGVKIESLSVVAQLSGQDIETPISFWNEKDGSTPVGAAVIARSETEIEVKVGPAQNIKETDFEDPIARVGGNGMIDFRDMRNAPEEILLHFISAILVVRDGSRINLRHWG